MKILLLIFITTFSTLSFASTYPILVKSNPFPGSTFFVPNDTNQHTSVIMLHGSEGGSNGYINSEASILATQGYEVLVLCYFDCNRDLTDPRQTLKNVEATKVLDAVAWLKTQSQSNSKVVVYGFSRGAELTMIVGSLTMTDNNRPNALIAHSPSDVFNFAWNWDWLTPACWLCKAGVGKCPVNSTYSDYQWNPSCGPDDTKLSQSNSAWLISGTIIPSLTRIEIEKYDGPILITVGDKDEVWPVDQTKRIEATLNETGKKPEIHYFANEGHNFTWKAEITRREMVLDFLKRIP